MIHGADLFRLHDIYGFPIAESLSECRRRDIPCDLIGFVFAALKAGWKSEAVQLTLREALADCPVERRGG